jgi:hypothetical protein
VKHIEVRGRQDITGTFLEEPTRTWILDYVSDRVMLPRLKTFSLCHSSQDEFRGHQFWIEALIPDTLEEFSLEADDKYRQLLDTVISKRVRLARLSMHTKYNGKREFWNNIIDLSAPQALTILDLYDCDLNNDVLVWISKMPKLAELTLVIFKSPRWRLAELPAHLITQSPSDLFKTLRYLTIHVRDDNSGYGLLKQIWKTALVSHITHLGLSIYSHEGTNLERCRNFLASLALKSPNICQLILNDPNQNPWHELPEMTVDLLSSLRSLPIRIFEIFFPIIPPSGQSVFSAVGGIWNNLEGLYLSGSVVELHDLLQAPVDLPQLQNLEISLWPTKPSPEPLTDALSSYLTESKHPHSGWLRRRSLGLFFRGDYHWRYQYDTKDWDVLARYEILMDSYVPTEWAHMHRILVERWSNIYVAVGDPRDICFGFSYPLQERISYYSSQVQNQGNEATGT